MRGVAMKKEILLTIVFLFLAQGVFSSGWDTGTIGSREAAASPALKVKSIHPLPEWDNPADLQPRGTVRGVAGILDNKLDARIWGLITFAPMDLIDLLSLGELLDLG